MFLWTRVKEKLHGKNLIFGENCTESITLSFKASDRGNVHSIALWFYSWKTT